MTEVRQLYKIEKASGYAGFLCCPRRILLSLSAIVRNSLEAMYLYGLHIDMLFLVSN